MEFKPSVEPVHIREVLRIVGLRKVSTPANGNCLAIALAQAFAESALAAPAMDQELFTAALKRGIKSTGLLNLEDQLPHDLRVQALKNVGHGEGDDDAQRVGLATTLVLGGLRGYPFGSDLAGARQLLGGQ
ncbi:unnamed protein product [Hyaloperonospora brassicae]|uniref:Uncharacterized protein n=1 Tax=Hyaloperonospora brassicae TaxID=162125 RepID=A0AAV0TXN5_HYABA|nr:unnamed protein product [Hyaloperonospora brassicae]